MDNKNIKILIDSIARNCQNSETKYIYNKYANRTLNYNVTYNGDSKIIDMLDGDILIINEQYNIAFIKNQDNEICPNSIIMFNDNYKYKYNLFVDIYEEEELDDMDISQDSYCLVYNDNQKGEQNDVYITPEVNSFFLKNYKAIEQLIGEYTFLFLVHTSVDEKFNGFNTGFIIFEEKGKYFWEEDKDNHKVYKVTNTNNKYILNISGHNLTDIYDIYFIDSKDRKNRAFINATKAKEIGRKSDVFNDFILDILESYGYTESDISENENIKLYKNNEKHRVLKFENNKLEFLRNMIFNFNVEYNRIKKFKKYEEVNIQIRELQSLKNGFIKTVKSKSLEHKNYLSDGFFMVVENGERWRNMEKHSNIMYVSNGELDVDDNDFAKLDIGNGFYMYLLHESKDKELLNIVIKKSELLLMSKIDRNSMQDTGFGVYFKDNKNNVFIFDNERNLFILRENDTIEFIPGYNIMMPFGFKNNMSEQQIMHLYKDQYVKLSLCNGHFCEQIKVLKYLFHSDFIIYREDQIYPYKDIKHLKPKDKFLIFKRDLEMFEEKLHELSLKYSIEDLVYEKPKLFYYIPAHLVSSNPEMYCWVEIK